MYFQQDAGANYDPATELDPVTGYPEFCAIGTLGTTCATVSAGKIHNFGFANFAGFPNTRDVGVLILDQTDRPLRVRAASFGRTARQPGYCARQEGHGIHRKRLWSFLQQPETFSRSEHFVSRPANGEHSTLVNLNSARNRRLHNVQTQGNGNDRGGTCSGDSGGPVFLEARHQFDCCSYVVRIERHLPRHGFRISCGSRPKSSIGSIATDSSLPPGEVLRRRAPLRRELVASSRPLIADRRTTTPRHSSRHALCRLAQYVM